MRSLCAALALLSLAGCRRGGPIDPTDPSQLAPCPEGEPHLVVALRSVSSDTPPALLRYDARLAPCRGVVFAGDETATPAAVAGLADGTELVGLQAPYGGSGHVLRLGGDAELARAELDLPPIGLAPLTSGGQAAVAILLASPSSSSDRGERLDVVVQADLSSPVSFDVPSEVVRIAAATAGREDRLAALLAGRGLQEYRLDPGASALATTGELQVAAPQSGLSRSLDVAGALVRAAARDGVLFWQIGLAPAFLGPAHCRWPGTTGTALPDDGADYVSVAIDPRDPDAVLVLVEGELAGGSSERSHLYVLRRRGECELVASVPDRFRAVGLAWAGR